MFVLRHKKKYHDSESSQPINHLAHVLTNKTKRHRNIHNSIILNEPEQLHTIHTSYPWFGYTHTTVCNNSCRNGTFTIVNSRSTHCSNQWSCRLNGQTKRHLPEELGLRGQAMSGKWRPENIKLASVIKRHRYYVVNQFAWKTFCYPMISTITFIRQYW